MKEIRTVGDLKELIGKFPDSTPVMCFLYGDVNSTHTNGLHVPLSGSILRDRVCLEPIVGD